VTRLRLVLAAAVAATLAVAGIAVALYASRQPRAVFQSSSLLSAVTTTVRVPTGSILNFGISGLYNSSGAPVTVRSLQLIRPAGPAIRGISAAAYFGSGLVDPVGLQGDLPRTCPEHFRPQKVTDFSGPAYSQAAGELMLSFRILRPGRYYLGEIRINYESDGRLNWQPYYLAVTIVAVSPRADPKLVQPYTCGRGAFEP
jgi:hypothetical protein